MKVSIVLLACFISCASTEHLTGYAAPAEVSIGSSSQFREEDSYGNYKFGYDEAHATGRTGRHEERNGNVVHGSYSLASADGRDRTVHYVADASGFRATIHTNEPGVDASRDPASVLINKEGVAAVPAPERTVVGVAPAYRPASPVHYRSAAAIVATQAPLPSSVFAAKGYAGPVPSYAPEPAYESPQRQAFSYSFGTTHPAYVPAPAPLYAPAPAPAYAQVPIYQQSIKY